MDFDEERHIIEDDDFIAIEDLMGQISCLTQDNFQLWYLYKQFNIKYFDDEEKVYLDDVIEKLKEKQIKINDKNSKKLKVVDLGIAKIL